MLFTLFHFNRILCCFSEPNTDIATRYSEVIQLNESTNDFDLSFSEFWVRIFSVIDFMRNVELRNKKQISALSTNYKITTIILSMIDLTKHVLIRSSDPIDFLNGFLRLNAGSKLSLWLSANFFSVFPFATRCLSN